MLFSVPRDGNQGLENAIFRPWRTENKELRSLFSVPGDGHLAYSMLFSIPRDGNRGLENGVTLIAESVESAESTKLAPMQ